jgi:hypothetical protein
MRRTPAAQLDLPLAEASKVDRVLDAIEAARQRTLELLEPVWRPKPDLHLVETRPDGTRLDAPPFVPPASWKLVERKGRLRADGTRTPARILRRMTVYFELLNAEELETYCAHNGCDMSEVVNEAVRRWLDRR